MKKRVLVSMMVLSLAAACMVGCGKKSEETSSTTTEATTEAKETEAKETQAAEAATEAPAETETETKA